MGVGAFLGLGVLVLGGGGCWLKRWTGWSLVRTQTIIMTDFFPAPTASTMEEVEERNEIKANKWLNQTPFSNNSMTFLL